MTNRISYQVSIPPEKTELLREKLRDMGINLDPEQDLLATQDEPSQFSHLTGAMIPELIEELNAYLERHQAQPAVPEWAPGWTTPRSNQFLQMALNEFTWLYGPEIEFDEWKRDGTEWARRTRKYPLVFEE